MLFLLEGRVLESRTGSRRASRLSIVTFRGD
jgi:hypothetical protein